MTKNRAQKQATRTRMEATGERYLQASRSATPVEVLAWEDEDGNSVIYGTHDAARGMEALHTYWQDCGFKSGDPEWPAEADELAFYESMFHRWTEPRAADDETPFDGFKEAAPGRVPYMYE